MQANLTKLSLSDLVAHVQTQQHRFVSYISSYKRFQQAKSQCGGLQKHTDEVEDKTLSTFRSERATQQEISHEQGFLSRATVTEEVAPVGLSRIFHQIEIGKSQNDKQQYIFELFASDQGIRLKTQVQTQEQRSFHLSNFNSFSQKQDGVGEFERLVRDIEAAAGKQVNEKGLNKIVQQIGTYVSETKNMTHKAEELVERSKCTRSKSKRIQLGRASLENINRLTPSPTTRKDDRNKENKIQFLAHGKHRKDSQQLKEQKGLKELKNLKELKIVRRNNPKCPSTMVYSEARHVNNYCILNKIYGKEKMRIDRAIAAEKEVVYLD